jgi:hypothetical protein
MKKFISVIIIVGIAYFGSGRIWIGNRVCITQGLCWNFGTPVEIPNRERFKNQQ